MIVKKVRIYLNKLAPMKAKHIFNKAAKQLVGHFK